MYRIPAIAVFTLLISSIPTNAQTTTAKVVSVGDGDTIRVEFTPTKSELTDLDYSHLRSQIDDMLRAEYGTTTPAVKPGTDILQSIAD
jgi:endonuclease YncB( thermonuclease family)